VCNQHSFLATYVQSHALQPRTYLFLCVICIFVSVRPITCSITQTLPVFCVTIRIFCQCTPNHTLHIYTCPTLACSPHSFLSGSSHHHLPLRTSSPGLTALVHGWHPMLRKPLLYRELYGILYFLMYSHTLSSDQKTMGFIL